MSPKEKAKLIREYKRLRKLARQVAIQADSFGESLAEVLHSNRLVKETEETCNDPVVAEGLPAIMEAMVPSMREAIRAELKAVQPLDEEWYEPEEIAEMSEGRVTAETIRRWVRWNQIDGESNGRQVRVFKHTAEELRKSKWRPMRQPDPAKAPRSRIALTSRKARERDMQDGE